MEEEKIFDALDQLPELVESIRINNKVNSDNINNINRRLSTLENVITSAADKMQKDITVNVPPANVRREDLQISVRLTDTELYSIGKACAETVAKKNTSILGLKIALIFAIITAIGITLLAWISYDSDYRGWAARYVDVAEIAGELQPEIRYIEVRDAFDAGKQSRKAIKAKIKALEEKYNDHYIHNREIITDDLSKKLMKDIVLMDYYIEAIDSTSYDAYIIYRHADKERKYAAHKQMDGTILVNTDNDLMTAKKAREYSKRKTWKKL